MTVRAGRIAVRHGWPPPCRPYDTESEGAWHSDFAVRHPVLGGNRFGLVTLFMATASLVCSVSSGGMTGMPMFLLVAVRSRKVIEIKDAKLQARMRRTGFPDVESEQGHETADCCPGCSARSVFRHGKGVGVGAGRQLQGNHELCRQDQHSDEIATLPPTSVCGGAQCHPSGQVQPAAWRRFRVRVRPT